MGNRGDKKRPVHDFQRVTKQIRTNESWYPTKDGQVQVSFMALTDGQWRVAVWGGDDFGLEKDFPHAERHEAQALFDLLVDFTTQEEMYEIGMGMA